MRGFISEIMIVAISVMVVMAITVVRLVPPIFNLISPRLGDVCRNKKLSLIIFILPELEGDIPWLMFGRLRRNTVQKSEPESKRSIGGVSSEQRYLYTQTHIPRALRRPIVGWALEPLPSEC
jgi:hypothetical protein